MRIIIAGSSGFVGSHLASYFEKYGHELILLSRKPNNTHAHYWDPELHKIDSSIFEGVDVVINLCGESIFGRWNQKKMEKIRDSRLGPTELLCNTLISLKAVPKVYIGASAIGYYGDRKEEILIENSMPGQGFLAEVCQNWEKIPKSLEQKNIRIVSARFGIVLGSNGGALQHIEKAFRVGMGGILGSGQQMMSWIAIDDVCGAMQHLIDHPEVHGPVNFVAPKAISNFEFTQTLGKVLNRSTTLPVPKFALTMFFGEGAEMFLASTNVYPQRLLESGYIFQFANLEEALKKYLIINM